MKYVRVYADSAGESHFEDLDVELTPIDSASPIPPLHLSSFAPAAGYGFVSAPEGWHRDWRPTLRREMYFYLAGEIESQMSDGEVRRFGPGSITLVEDTTGKGHASRVLGTGGALFAVLHLAD